MGFNLDAYFDEELPVLDAVDLAATASTDRPSWMDMWLWCLEDVVSNLLGRRPKTPEYDHLALYAHYHCLTSKEAVQNAPDDVLLEALGLPKVEHWGWLHFMVRELGRCSTLARNWGLPTLEGVNFCFYAKGSSEDDRRKWVVLHFLELMRGRGLNPLELVEKFVAALKSKYSEESGEDLGEEALLEHLRTKFEWAFYLYSYHDAATNPASLDEGGEIIYQEKERVRFLAPIREAADRRRLNWDGPHSCDCVERAAAELATNSEASVQGPTNANILK